MNLHLKIFIRSYLYYIQRYSPFDIAADNANEILNAAVDYAQHVADAAHAGYRVPPTWLATDQPVGG
jgi:hypothetical protein